MKFLLFVLPAGVLLAGAFLYFVGSTPETSEPLAPETSRPAGARNHAIGFDADAVLAQVAALSAEVERLTLEVTALRSEQSRRPIAAAEEALPEAVTAAAPIDRDTIVQVLEEERQREADERRAERERKELDKLLERAERVSRELGLGPDGEKQLGDVLIVERQKREDFIATVKTMGRSKEAGKLVRDGLRDIDAWRAQELGRHFGLDVAEEVEGLLDKKTDRRGRLIEIDVKKKDKKNSDS